MKQDVYLIIYYYCRAASPSTTRLLGAPSSLTYFYLRKKGIRVDTFNVDSPEAIEANICANNPTHVAIMAPWVQASTVQQWCRRWMEIQFAIVCHSNLAFLGADTGAGTRVRQYAELSREQHNFHLAANAKLTSMWARITHDADVLVLPNLYWIDLADWRPRQPYRGGTIDVGMFGAPRPLKNWPTGAGAVLVLQRQMGVPVNLHTNIKAEAVPHAADTAREMIGGDLHVMWFNHGWLAWPAFTRLIKRMTVLMQPSLSESFNVVTADGIAQGVCSAVGPAIDWVPRYWQANTDDPTAFAQVMRQLMTDQHAAYDGRDALIKYSADGFRFWQSWLEGTPQPL